MNREEFLFTHLIEECAEVQQRVAKILRFGLNQSQSNDPVPYAVDNPGSGTNFERLQNEFNDLCTVAGLLSLSYPTTEEQFKKIRKIELYLDYSAKLGRLK